MVMFTFVVTYSVSCMGRKCLGCSSSDCEWREETFRGKKWCNSNTQSRLNWWMEDIVWDTIGSLDVVTSWNEACLMVSRDLIKPVGLILWAFCYAKSTNAWDRGMLSLWESYCCAIGVFPLCMLQRTWNFGMSDSVMLAYIFMPPISTVAWLRSTHTTFFFLQFLSKFTIATMASKAAISTKQI